MPIGTPNQPPPIIKAEGQASVAAVEPYYITTPCRAIEGPGGEPVLMRADDNVVRLDGSVFARSALALGYKRVWIDGYVSSAPDQRVRRPMDGRIVLLDDEPRCNVGIEGAP